MAGEPSPYFDFNTFQQFYALSAISNAVTQKAGDLPTLEQAFQQTLGKLNHLSGSWTVAWGPTVYKKSPKNAGTGPDNAWVVTVDNNQKLCVVAIAGTSTLSDYAIAGDKDVTDIVDFDAWVQNWTSAGVPDPISGSVQTAACCSHGTALFIQNILNTPSPQGFAGSGTTLGQYLQTVPSDYKIVFTGHSLGGAVAPTVALGLVQKGLLSGSNVYTLPSAGATPGNSVFVTNYSKTFPKQVVGPDYQVFNTDYYNTNDVVPQAWSKIASDDRNLGNIIKIYKDASLKMNIYIRGLVVAARILPGMPYSPLPGQSFVGPTVAAVSTTDDLKLQLKIQHIDAYWAQFGIQKWVDYVFLLLDAQPGLKPSLNNVWDIPDQAFQEFADIAEKEDPPMVGDGLEIDPIRQWI